MNTTQAELAPVNILIADDRPSNLNALAAILRRPDYNLALARSGEEALALVLRQQFAVIVLDIGMPAMDGFETARIIKEREQSSRIPILFITASAYDMTHVFREYTVGAVDRLRKPVDAHELRAKVAVLVELFRQKKALERQAQDLSATRRLLRDQEEQAYGEREALFRRSFDQAPVGIGHLTPDGRWIEANVRLCEILDHSRAQLIGRSAADMVGGAADWKIKEAIARLAAGEARGQARERRVVPLKSGESSAVLWISAIREASNRVMMLVVVIDDASARVTGEPEREHPSQTPAPVRLASGGSDETSSLESLALQEVVP